MVLKTEDWFKCGRVTFRPAIWTGWTTDLSSHTRERREVYFLGRLSQKGSELTCVKQGPPVNNRSATRRSAHCELTPVPLPHLASRTPALRSYTSQAERRRVPRGREPVKPREKTHTGMTFPFLLCVLLMGLRRNCSQTESCFY